MTKRDAFVIASLCFSAIVGAGMFARAFIDATSATPSHPFLNLASGILGVGLACTSVVSAYWRGKYPVDPAPSIAAIHVAEAYAEQLKALEFVIAIYVTRDGITDCVWTIVGCDVQLSHADTYSLSLAEVRASSDHPYAVTHFHTETMDDWAEIQKHKGGAVCVYHRYG